MFNPASPVTGGPITSFTSPTYTLVSDSAPDVNGVAFAVSAVGGTQAGVLISSASNPFTVLFTRPKVLRTLPAVNANGILSSVPRNVYTLSVKKGVLPLAGQPNVAALGKIEFSVPAGSDLADKPNLSAMISLLAGLLWEQSNEIADSLVAGSL
jgi:hypothetical protein